MFRLRIFTKQHSKPARNRFLYGIISVFGAGVLCSFFALRAQLSEGPNTLRTATAINSSMPSATPVVAKEYIYAQGKLLATESSSSGGIKYEADVTPSPTGDGTVDNSDYMKIGNIVAGTDPLPPPGSEFQRADCAPRTTLGNASIGLADWIQAGRYYGAIDPLTPAGGPTGVEPPSGFTSLPKSVKALARTNNSEMRIVGAQLKRGQIGSVPIEFDASGIENGLAFTINFEQGQITFVDAVLGEALPKETRLLVNTKKAPAGRVAILIGLPPGQSLSAGSHRILSLRFTPTLGKGNISTDIAFDDSLVSRAVVTAEAAELPPPSYRTARVTIIKPL